MATKYFNQHAKARGAGRNTSAGRGGSPLSNDQKAAICILAREAFAASGQNGTDKEFQEWRREKQCSATGKQSLTDCDQGDYNKLRAVFLDLSGEPGKAMTAHIQDETEPERLAMFKLQEALRAHGLNMAYADAISRGRFKCRATDLGAKQLWWLVFTINNRGAQKSKSEDPF